MEPKDIKEIRLNLGMSQEGFAHYLGVSWNTINRWEKGVHKPSRLAIDKLSTLINKNNLPKQAI